MTPSSCFKTFILVLAALIVGYMIGNREIKASRYFGYLFRDCPTSEILVKKGTRTITIDCVDVHASSFVEL